MAARRMQYAEIRSTPYSLRLESDGTLLRVTRRGAEVPYGALGEEEAVA